MEETLVKKILKNEFAQISGILVAGWFFVTTVILPLQKVQIQLAQIQEEINASNANYQKVMDIHQSILDRLIRLESKIK